MQSVSSRIWTRIAVTISYDDNHYTTDTSSRISSCYSIYNIIIKRYISSQMGPKYMETPCISIVCELFLKRSIWSIYRIILLCIALKIQCSNRSFDLRDVDKDWLIDFNDISNHQGLFHMLWLRNCVYCIFIFAFFAEFLKLFAHGYMPSSIPIKHR